MTPENDHPFQLVLPRRAASTSAKPHRSRPPRDHRQRLVLPLTVVAAHLQSPPQPQLTRRPTTRRHAILDASGAGGSPAKIFNLYLPDEFKGIYDEDDRRYKAGRPNAFDLYDPAKP
jgi:hypothetical protein